MTSPASPILAANDKADIRRRFLAVDTCNVADVLDTMDVLHQGLHPEFAPFATGAPKLAGWAFTIRGQMAPFTGSGDPAKMQACQAIGADEVSVWSGDGQGVCYFGELIALGMKERGAVGALVDGGVRDTRWLGEHGIPVFARYRTPVQSIGRWRVTGWGEPVWIAGATTERVLVSPGDFILADEDGAIAIPGALVMSVLEQAERLTAMEVRIREELHNGLSLAEALDKFGHV